MIPKLNISQAARASGKGRSTIIRYLKSGKLSYELDTQDNKVIDPSELIRVFGELESDGALQKVYQGSSVEHHDTSEGNGKAHVDTIQKRPKHDSTFTITLLEQKVEDLERQVESLKEEKGDLKQEREIAREREKELREIVKKQQTIVEQQQMLLLPSGKEGKKQGFFGKLFGR